MRLVVMTLLTHMDLMFNFYSFPAMFDIFIQNERLKPIIAKINFLSPSSQSQWNLPALNNHCNFITLSPPLK